MRNGAVQLSGLIAPHDVALLGCCIECNIREPSSLFKNFGVDRDGPGAILGYKE